MAKCEIKWWIKGSKFPVITKGKHVRGTKFIAFRDAEESIRALEDDRKINPPFFRTVTKIEIKCRR